MGKKVDLPGAVKDGQHKGRPSPSTRDNVSVNLLRTVKVATGIKAKASANTVHWWWL